MFIISIQPENYSQHAAAAGRAVFPLRRSAQAGRTEALADILHGPRICSVLYGMSR
jgi:hypothetical protein